MKLSLLRAALSKGKDIDIRSAEIDGLTVNVVRLPDGTTNLEALEKKIAQSAPPKKEEPQKPSDLSFLRIDHAALRDAKIAFVDKSRGGTKELAIQHLDVTVNDLRAGKPLEVLVKAAVLAEKQNLELRVKEFGRSVARCVSPGRRVVLVNFELYEHDDDVTKGLYQAARQQAPIEVMLQLGQQSGQLFGARMKSVIPQVPAFDDSDGRLQWKFANSQAQGTVDDEITVAFG